MNRQRLALVAAIGIVLAVALAVAGGIGPFASDEGTIDDFPTETTTPPTGPDDGATAGGDGSGDGGAGDDGPSGGDAGATTTERSTPRPPFSLQIDSVETCGRTCRDVTATLVNRQDRRATGTTVYTRIYEGQGTGGDVVWEGTHEVGTLAAGASDTETQRVELSYFEAVAIQQNGGWITIVTTIETDRRTVTFRERRDVA